MDGPPSPDKSGFVATGWMIVLFVWGLEIEVKIKVKVEICC